MDQGLFVASEVSGARRRYPFGHVEDVLVTINVDSMLFRIFFIYLSDMAVALRCSYGPHSICINVFLY